MCICSSSEDWATEVFSTLKSAIPVTFEPSVLDFREQYEIYSSSCIPSFTIHPALCPTLPSTLSLLKLKMTYIIILTLTLSLSLRPTGMPALREVKIINPHNSLTLQLTSISGELSEFHTSFFKSKVCTCSC